MPRDRQKIGQCTSCKLGAVNCSHNLFMDGTQEIHSWEHCCSDCGHRETAAFRSDEENPELPGNPTVCPFCGRQAPG